MCLNMVKTSLHEIWFHFSNMRFSTNDQENDLDSSRHCSQRFKGAWWYRKCHHSNLNGLYLNGSQVSYANGVNWLSFRGYHYSLKQPRWKWEPKHKTMSPRNGNLNEPVLKSSNAGGVFGGGDVEAFELTDAWPTRKQFELKSALNLR